jgi:hypothetical protein
MNINPRSGQSLEIDLLCRYFCELGKKPPIPANPDSISWFPACAGMTKPNKFAFTWQRLPFLNAQAIKPSCFAIAEA